MRRVPVGKKDNQVLNVHKPSLPNGRLFLVNRLLNKLGSKEQCATLESEKE